MNARLSWIVIGVMLCVAICTSTAAQERERDDAIQSLLRRIEQLEKQVAELQKQLSEGPAEEAATQARDSDVTAHWKDGLQLETRDKRVKLHIGGRLHHDMAWFFPDDGLQATYGDFEDATEFRRARICLSGQFASRYEFKAEYDFAGGDANLKDAWLGCKRVPVVGNVRFGHLKEPFSLERLTSGNNITFMERSLANAFVPGRNVGLLCFDSEYNNRLTWAAGVFHEADDYGTGSGDGKYSFTTRVTGLPYFKAKDQLVHIGLGYSYRNPVGDQVRFRERPVTHLAPRLVDTGALDATSINLVGAELAVLHGSASLQAEYVRASVDVPGAADPTFDAYYIMGSYFLSGSGRNYSPSKGVFGMVRPTKNAFEDRGKGAWEVAARYSHIDLGDAGVSGGSLGEITLGLNWYLNPNARMMWNVVFANPDGPDNVTIFQMRSQVAF